MLPFQDERLHHVPVASGIEEGEQWMHCAERIPQGKVVVILEAAGKFGALIAGKPRVGAAYVAELTWQQQRVVKRGIEDASYRTIWPVDSDRSQTNSSASPLPATRCTWFFKLIIIALECVLKLFGDTPRLRVGHRSFAVKDLAE